MFKKSLKSTFNLVGTLLATTALFSSFINVPATQAQNQALCITNCGSSSTTASSQSSANMSQAAVTPKVNLITVTCSPETCTTGGQLDWSKAVISNNQQFTDYNCTRNAQFANQILLGVDDYKDGLSLKTFKGYPETQIQTVKNNYAAKRMACSYMDEKAGNVEGCNYTFLSVETYEDSQRPKLTVCSIPSGNFTGQNTPVYAYQFRYNINFTETNKTEQSNAYRSMTAIDGVYDGVAMTYTYYTYAKDGQYLPWQNPHKDNANGGWLVYGLQNDGTVNCLALNCPSSSSQSLTQSSMMFN